MVQAKAHARQLISSEENDRIDIVKDFINQVGDEADLDIEKLSRIFALIDNEFLDTPEEDLKRLDKVDLKQSCLSGLNRRRSEIEILALILKSAREGVHKTGILFKANLSGLQLKKYLGFLTDTGFLVKDGKKRRGALYKTTQKGNLFLYHWTRIVNLLNHGC
jgi:predicted transcriptional regulator